jgi:hypothetical protein
MGESVSVRGGAMDTQPVEKLGVGGNLHPGGPSEVLVQRFPEG